MILYKFRSYEQLHYIADILVNERLYCSKLDELNDPFEGHYIFQIKLQNGLAALAGKRNYTITQHREPRHDRESADKLRICSLSGSMSDVRLWSFYGGSHRGVAIGVDFDIDSDFEEDSDTGVFKVNTNHLTLPIIEEDGTNTNKVPLKKAVTNKTSIWNYEDEYRIITSKQFHSIKGKIREIITGPLMTSREQEVILKLAGEIPVFNSRLDHSKLCVEKAGIYRLEDVAKGIREAFELPISEV
ncbi:MAG: DUF2971 domain-containing protein [Akkermansiaceae bacterium]|jgi:hypothetical protein|nr:DUF2971 domain-containing protein [Luteolibacter sp.]